MVGRPVKPVPTFRNPLTRRELLRVSAGLAAGWAAGPLGAAVRMTGLDGVPVERPWWWAAEPERARVVECREARVVHAGELQEPVVREMLELGLNVFVGVADAASAWRQVLGNARRILLKFNRVGAATLATNEVVATALVDSLEAAGFERREIVAAELPGAVLRALGVRAAADGWSDSLQLDGEDEPLAAYLQECDALINVPLLKTHRLAGMSGALKNVSHAVVRRPARYHGNGCAPYIGQIVGSGAIAGRLRLNVGNALRIVYAQGPEARKADVSAYGALLFSRDPVALDTVGLSILRAERQRLKCPGAITVSYLEDAGAREVGRATLHGIERLRVPSPVS